MADAPHSLPPAGGPAWAIDRTALHIPDPAIEAVDPRFLELRIWQSVVQRLWTGGQWLEGPVWFGDGRYLLFSDIPGNRILRWTEETNEVSTVFRAPADNANGHTRDRAGRLVSCEHLTRRVTRTEHDGSITVLVDEYDGRPLNAPNDVTVSADGAVWFTDPGWGIINDYEGDRADPELPMAVYRIDPDTGETAAVITEMARPNGICFSPDESLLYVVDTGEIRVFDMVDGLPANGRRFVDMAPGNSDGIRCDTAGNVWSAAAGGGAGFDGVHCYHPDGTLLGRIVLPEACANLTFGGREAQPAVHGRDPVAVLGLRQRERRPTPLSRPPPGVGRGTQTSDSRQAVCSPAKCPEPAISSAGVPSSTIRPCSITSTRSAISTVDSRCAMITAVRPCSTVRERALHRPLRRGCPATRSPRRGSARPGRPGTPGRTRPAAADRRRAGRRACARRCRSRRAAPG